jgi:hypothetical protein
MKTLYGGLKLEAGYYDFGNKGIDWSKVLQVSEALPTGFQGAVIVANDLLEVKVLIPKHSIHRAPIRQ